MPDAGAEEAADPIRVVIVDDHEMFTESVSQLLQAEPGIEVVGIAPTMAEGVALVEVLRPTIALVDFRLPDGQGTDAATSIRAVSDTTRTLIITGSTAEPVVVAAIKAGCYGVITKDKAFAVLVEAIRQVAAGESYVDPLVLAEVARVGTSAAGLGVNLTKREREILQHLAQGQSNHVIGETLFVSRHTVRNHVQNILTKLGVHSKLEAVFVARQEGLLDDQS
jgi:DNA-binding NarL/FixJ family response regulator